MVQQVVVIVTDAVVTYVEHEQKKMSEYPLC